LQPSFSSLSKGSAALVCLPDGGESRSPGHPANGFSFAGWPGALRRFFHRPSRGPTALADRKRFVMANILVSIEKGIEIGAEDALKWLAGGNRAVKAAPGVIAALGTLIGSLDKPIGELAAAAANPLNIALDIQTAQDLKSVWPDVKQFLTTLGVKF
jgi:hypothetical protein